MVNIQSKLRAERLTIRGSLPGMGKTSSGDHPAAYSMSTRVLSPKISGPELKLTAHHT
jgi:hypothetical protein